MNLLFVYNSALISTRGGTERVACRIADALQKAGHNIYYMSTDASPEDVERLQSPKYFFIDSKLDYEKKKNLVCDICQNYHIDVLINEWGEYDDFSIFSNKILPDVKIITCLHFDVFGFIKNRPRGESNNPIKRLIIKSLFSLGIDLYAIKLLRNYRGKHRTMLKVSDAVVVVTPVIAKELKRLTCLHPEKIVSIFNPIPFDVSHPTYDTATKEKVFLFVGRLAPVKNVDILLKAWGEIAHLHPEWKLEIAGSGSLQDNLLQQVEEMNIPRVKFHGHVENVGALYNRAEYLVLPSEHESFSCVVLESMAYGCHPIVFDYPSAPVVIPNSRLGTRIKHSTKALAKAMSKAIQTNTSNREHMEEVAAHLATFDIEKIAPNWESLIEKLSSNK